MMEKLVLEFIATGILLCLIPCVIAIVGTLLIVVWSFIAGAFGPDSYHDNVRQTFWRLMRKFGRFL